MNYNGFVLHVLYSEGTYIIWSCVITGIDSGLDCLKFELNLWHGTKM